MKKNLLLIIIAMFCSCTTFAQSSKSEAIIKKELAKYIQNGLKNPKVILSAKAKAELKESEWPEIQCQQTGDLDSVGPNVTIEKVGKNAYRYSCDCTCGKERYTDNWTIFAIYVNGKVKITSFK